MVLLRAILIAAFLLIILNSLPENFHGEFFFEAERHSLCSAKLITFISLYIKSQIYGRISTILPVLTSSFLTIEQPDQTLTYTSMLRPMACRPATAVQNVGI